LENWRNFTKVGIDLSKRAFLVGPNASGKSNLLDGFRFLHDLVAIGGGLQEAVRKRGGISRLRCLAARQKSDVLIGVRIGDEYNPEIWEYTVAISQDNLRKPILKQERVVKKGDLILQRPDPMDETDPERRRQTFLEQVNVNKEFRDISTFLQTIRYLHIVPQLIREPDRSVGHKNDPYGGDFLEQIARTGEKTQKARLRRIRDALSVAVPQLRELVLEPDERGTPHLRGRYEHWRHHGAWQTEVDFSDGTLRLMGILWSALEGTGPMLFEEPELSLHPEVVRYIPQMFARLQRKTGRQIFISTHSPELLRDEGVGQDEVLLLMPTKEGTEVRRASEFSEIKDLLEGGVSMADAVLPQTRPASVEQLSLFGDNV
jgi:predicted ATPase